MEKSKIPEPLEFTREHDLDQYLDAVELCLLLEDKSLRDKYATEDRTEIKNKLREKFFSSPFFPFYSTLREQMLECKLAVNSWLSRQDNKILLEVFFTDDKSKILKKLFRADLLQYSHPLRDWLKKQSNSGSDDEPKDEVQKEFDDVFTEIDSMHGVEFEEYIGRILGHLGYTISYTKSSGDFGADIIAVQNGIRYAVQVKRQSGPVSRNAISDVVGALGYYRCHRPMVITNNYFNESAKELALANGCDLVDRDILRGWINSFIDGSPVRTERFSRD